MPISIAQATIVARHESGHLIVARSLGFPTGDIVLTAAEGGAEIDLYPSLPTLDHVKEFLNARVKILYAGSLAECLVQKKCDRKRAIVLLNSTAKNDYAKVRELSRTLVGITHPDASPADFQNALDTNDLRLFGEASRLVEANQAVIITLMQYVAREFVKAKTDNFTLTAAEIDSFLADKTIVT